MNSPRTKFYKDKQNAKWAGVCAGIADYTGIDVTIVDTVPRGVDTPADLETARQILAKS